MKKAFLAVALVMFGAQGFKPMPDRIVPAGKTEAQCEFTLKQAQVGLKGLTAVDFVVKEESPDGNMQLGLEVFHNPKSADPASIDAAQVVVRDKRRPGKEVVFAVLYDSEKQFVAYERIKNADNTMTECFSKKVTLKSEQKLPE